MKILFLCLNCKMVAFKFGPHSIIPFKHYMSKISSKSITCLKSPLKSPIIAHRHICLQMFEGKYLTNNLKYGYKNICVRMFLKFLMENTSKHYKIIGMKTSCY